MSQTTTQATSPAADAVQKFAGAVFGELAKLGQDWSAIKASPTYGPLVQLGAALVQSELAANGVPIAPLVNVALAVESAVQTCAALHPAIST
jgi:hypothetical protein